MAIFRPRRTGRPEPWACLLFFKPTTTLAVGAIMRESNPSHTPAAEKPKSRPFTAGKKAIENLVSIDWQTIYRYSIAWRHQLHQIPELGYQEKLTSDAIARVLKQLQIPYKRGFGGGTGILAQINGRGDRCVALRADMDALPVTELTGMEWQSRHPGLMHACGHDGHMAIALGAAAALAHVRNQLPGRVKILFQPAEEGLNGAQRMCRDGVLENPKVDAIFGLHGWPGLPVGTIGYRQGVFLAAVDSLVIEIHGKGTHAASPHHGADPIACGAALLQALAGLLASNIDPIDTVVLTIGTFNAGRASNVVPESATLSGTLRTLSPTTRRQAVKLIQHTCRTVAATHRCKAACRFTSTTPTTVNAAPEANFLRKTASSLLGSAKVIEFHQPFLWSEDFAYYLKRVPGCFFVLGVRPPGRREYPMLHNPLYDFPDAALPTGIRLMTELAYGRLNAP